MIAKGPAGTAIKQADQRTGQADPTPTRLPVPTGLISTTALLLPIYFFSFRIDRNRSDVCTQSIQNQGSVGICPEVARKMDSSHPRSPHTARCDRIVRIKTLLGSLMISHSTSGDPKPHRICQRIWHAPTRTYWRRRRVTINGFYGR